MATLINTKLGIHRGKSRIWLQGIKLSREGYEAGKRYDMTLERRKVVLKPCVEGRYIISRRKRGDRLDPVIDITRKELADLFSGVEMLRVQISEGSIVITAHGQTDRIAEREKRLLDKIKTGGTLRVGSLFHGGGVLDRALHEGFAEAGIRTKVGAAVELEGKYLDASLANNPEIWDKHSIPMETPLQALNLRGTPLQFDVVAAGIPCTGASLAGRASNHLQHAEDHDHAGALFFNFLSFVEAVNPAIVIGENVVPYQTSAGMSVVRSVLGSLGYDVHERIMSGNECGALENRERLCIVAISKGFSGSYNIADATPTQQKPATIASILEPFADIPDTAWKTYDYMADKAERDLAAGKGFKRQLVTADAEKVGTIGRGYSKARSTEPFLIHPYDDSLSRLFTPKEHARLKSIPESVISGLSATIAHQILGQSVIFPMFTTLARSIGEAFQRIAAPVQRSLAA